MLAHNEEYEHRLDELIAEYLDCLESGQPLDESTWLAAHQEFHADLTQFLANRQRVERLARPLRNVAAWDSSAFVGCLGDFQLVRELGRGGMGVVYEAEQISLARRVAVKVLPFAAMLDGRQLQRFKNEARAAALLKHPNIVSVHAVGCERGTHFYVMELVEGRSLAELNVAATDSGCHPTESPAGNRWIDHHAGEGPEPPRPDTEDSSNCGPKDTARVALKSTKREVDRCSGVARLGVQAALALSYAHANGVIHRDIKPSNLLLDGQGRLWVTDFGLARVQDAGELTLTGDVLGTLRYMSPEQLSGAKVVDERTDIYSLGLTLYEMLTGQPAFTEQLRENLIQCVLFEEPPAPRSIVADIPRDLETIVLKAIAKEREARYQSAAEFADDLQRFLESRPIRARRATRLRRLRYWARRNPVLATMTAALLTAVTLGLMGTTYGWVRSSERAEAYRALLYRSEISTALEAWRTGDAQKAQELLERHLPSAGQRDLRGFEWYYLWRTVGNSGAERIFHHDQPVAQLAFLDDHHVAARMLRGEIRLLDIEQSTSRRPTTAEFATGMPLTFHGGGEAWAYYYALNDTAEAIERNSVAAAVHNVMSRLGLWNPIVSPAGDLLAGGTYQNEAKLVEVASGKVRATLSGHDGILLGLEFSPDGQLLVTAGRDGRAFVWKTSDGSRVAAIDAHANSCEGAAFSPDGRWLVTSGRDECIRIWDASNFTELQQIDVSGAPKLVAFSLNCRLMATAGNSNLIHLWRTDDWSLLQTLKGHTGSINVLCFSPDCRRLASGAGDGDVRIWRLDQPPADVPWFMVGDEVRSLAFHPQQNVLASGSWDGSVHLWDVERRAPLADFELRNERVLAVAIDPTGDWLATAGDSGVLRIFNLGDGRQRTTLKSSDGGIASIAFSRMGDLVACGPNAVYYWERTEFLNSLDVATTAHRFAVQSYPQALALSRDGRRVLLANLGSPTFELRQFPDGTVIAQSAEGGGQIVMAAASSSREDIFATGARDGTIRIWEDESLACRHVLRGHSNYVIGLAFSPSEDILASASLDGTVRLWDTKTGTERASFTGHTIGASSVAFSHRGDMLATGDLKGNMRIFVAANAAEVARELANSSAPARNAATLTRPSSPRGP